MADLVTPNRHEASLLTGIGPITDLDRLRRAADTLFRMIDGPAVLVKGGEALPGAVDLLIDGLGEEYPLSRAGAPLETTSTHGTGCTLSAAIAAFMARGKALREACAGAKEYVFGAIENAPGLGAGHGPIDHGWMR
jgi:hydroxymethylpyrimidine/phosphomethylpyrimidine kinase